MQLALSRPEQVDKLVVADVAPVAYEGITMPSWPRSRRWRKLLRASRAEAEAILRAGDCRSGGSGLPADGAGAGR